MKDKPPPFKGYSPVSSPDLWAKILTGEIEPHVYSAEANGSSKPQAISPAEFFRAEPIGRGDVGADDSGEPARLGQYQIMLRDRDRDRPSAIRRAIPVPHWVYVAQEAPQPKHQPAPRARAKRDRVKAAAKSLWPPTGDPPDTSALSNPALCGLLGSWIKADCKQRGIPVVVPSDETMLRAVGRK